MFIIERLLSLVAPHCCIVCDSEGSLLCAWCLPDSLTLVPERCYRCRAANAASQVCQKCRRQSPLRHVWVRTWYEDTARQLVYGFKFDRQQAAVAPLAQLTAEALPYLDRRTVVTHVPTASSRIRLRGYDHAQLLAKTLARRLELPYAPLLIRHGQVRQVGARRSQRLSQLQDAFRVIRPQTIAKAHILLVDDILTTGATVEAAGRMLKKAGARSVDAVVFAQKQ